MGKGLTSRDNTQSLLWHRELEYFKAVKFTEKKVCQISEMCTDACLDRYRQMCIAAKEVAGRKRL